MKRILVKLELIIGCLVIGLLFGSDVKADDEKIFEDANSYTVKIKTQVEIPFKEDEAGVFSGAGFLVDQERGWIMTNAHVVSKSPSKVEVAFKDQDYYLAKKIYLDSYLDLAILEISPEHLPATINKQTLNVMKGQKLATPLVLMAIHGSFHIQGQKG